MIDLEYLTIAGVVLVIAELAGILLAFDVVMRPRSSQGTIAWFIALITMPLITIPLYLLFGRTRFQGYAEAIRDKQTRIGDQWTDWHTDMLELAALPNENLASIEAVARRLTGIPFTRGNKVELLIDGEATYNSMLEAIAMAETCIFIQF